MGTESMTFTGGEDPLTVADWALAQASGNGNQLARLLALVEKFDATDPAWIFIVPQHHIRQQWQKVESIQKKERDLLPLFGVPFAVKDNIDVAGLPTTAGCLDFSYIATEDAAVVQTLQRAGAVVVGKCNLDQFATGLVGSRSPDFGAVPNTYNREYISGGSSSGSASVVARGLVPFSLGTDTAGSGGVPAGFNNIVGLKATPGALSTRGVVPACRSLDCVSIFTLTVGDARLVFGAAAHGYSRPNVNKPLRTPPRLAICDNPPWFDREDFQCQAYLQSLKLTQRLGWQLQPTGFSSLFQLAALLYEGPWVAERYVAIKDFIERPDVRMDHVVRRIIEQAKNFSAADLFACEYIKKDLIHLIEDQFRDFDAVLVPTASTFPTLEKMKRSPVTENSLLGTYTNFVNFLDWAAISIPAGFRADGLPFGLTIISKRGQEHNLFQLAEQFLGLNPRRLGATQAEYRDTPIFSTMAASDSDQALVIVGAHLSGFPLNYQLTEAGATFHRVTKTTQKYRLYVLPTLSKIQKPGLRRVSSTDEPGHSIEVEVWNISNEGLGSLMKLVPPPLGIGSVEVEDGTWLKGFICEPWGFEGAIDISEFGGWKTCQNSLAKDVSNLENGILTPRASASPRGSLLKSVLIANRGEIAVRIISTLKGLGIRSIAVYSTEDAKAQHVFDADEAYLLDGASLAETYLSGSALIRIAQLANVDAVIPGYGFLSESADFARECEGNGLVWIGPTPEQMEQLGLKHLARNLARKSDVPLLPGTGVIADIETAVAEAEKVRYPIMVKSSAGGGGIGLKQCQDVQELRDSFDSISHLGQSYFNDSRIFIEKFVQEARHVEVQIIGDGKGLVKHIGERDCSLQRRKQKVIEECPAIFIPDKIRESMRRAAVNLAGSVQYRGVGTVEFIYDLKEKSFYFLEVNTRLQVEHCVTEAATGLDLVEAMVRVASDDSAYLFHNMDEGFPLQKIAIEARIYGESPLQDFRPSPGQILDVDFPEGVRVDTWITSGTIVSPSYDPLLAKLTVSGFDRPEAIRNLAAALDETKISGIETNLQYLKQIIRSDEFKTGTYTTTSLDTFKANIPAFEVLDPGPSTTVQDFPGRVGYWDVGIPPSGPMDNYSFRLANRVLGNDPGAAGLECTSAGPILLFHHDAYVAVVGGHAALHVDEEEFECGRPVKVRSGQTLRLGTLDSGCRTYIAVRGGIQVPEIFESRSTFVLGKTGGHCGRPLRIGDIVPFDENASVPPPDAIAPTLPGFTSTWFLKVMPGPHAFPDFLSRDSFSELFEGSWKIHYNSNRVGIRLMGPKPSWARDHGGESGLHPSNIHDSPYSIGSISFTGDEAVILTCDGPSLGGFMIFATIITADMWKLGQARPGDEIRLLPVTTEEAAMADVHLRHSIENLTPLVEVLTEQQICDPILVDVGEGKERLTYRQAGSCAILLEFGEDCFDIRTSFRIYAFINAHKKLPIPGVLELTPGVRALHVLYEHSISQKAMIETLHQVSCSLNQDLYIKGIPSRTFHLPLAFEHSSVQAVIARYSQTIRSSAPWVPSNTDFLRRINGLSTTDEVNNALLSCPFLILGLGDVFFGSPCAVPLDPRHRLFGMKYNPSRSFTAEGQVGVGGQYLCIYAIDSPGGYQLVGRTVPIWSKFSRHAKKHMFNVFDQISFYPVSESELNASREKGDGGELIKVQDGTFDLQAYEQWLHENKEDIESVRAERMKALRESDVVAEAMKPPPPPKFGSAGQGVDADAIVGGIVLRAGLAGKCWKVAVGKGDLVEKGQTLFIIEAMKMEIKINSPCNGVCVDIFTATGDILSPDTRMAVISSS